LNGSPIGIEICWWSVEPGTVIAPDKPEPSCHLARLTVGLCAVATVALDFMI
jgi:Leu/Phe-tRNA-protein transferase